MQTDFGVFWLQVIDLLELYFLLKSFKWIGKSFAKVVRFETYSLRITSVIALKQWKNFRQRNG
jgi:hypothetical protein